jgi:predicted alpha/beta superfamily hydrolase
LAIDNYKKALEIDPNFASVKRALKDIKKKEKEFSMTTKTIFRVMPAFITAFLLFSSAAYGQADKDTLTPDRLGQGNKIIIGETFKIHSDILNEDRHFLVYLPDNYSSSQMKYPVIFLLDGDYFFLPTAGMVEFLSKINKAPKMIVVAIVNTDRFRDFSPPTRDADNPDPSDTGDGARFLAFLKDELLPYMNTNYRTETYHIFVGHSLGGLFVIHTLLSEPQLFGAYISISPALFWNGGSEVTKAGKVFDRQMSLKKYLYMTYSEGDGSNTRSSTDKLVNILETQAPKDFKWKFAFMPNDRHNSSPLRSTYDGLELLFSRWEYLGEDDSGKLVQHYASLSEKFGFECKPTEDAAASVGRNLVRKGNLPEAIKVYQYIVKIYPHSADAYERLGEAYMKAGNTTLAIESYEKSLRINPQNSRVTENLKKLREK